MPRRTSAKNAADEAEYNIIFPFIDVELQSGRKVAVRQWNIEKGAVLTARTVSLIQKLQGKVGEVELEELITLAQSECQDIVAETIGWTKKQLNERANYEDFLTLLQAVIDTSLVREDGQGALPKIIGIAGKLVPLVGVPTPAATAK